MLGADDLMMLVHEDARHAPYTEQFRMKLGRVGKGQKGKPSIIAFKFEVVITGRDGHRQLVMIPLFTMIIPNSAPHVATGLKSLVSSLTSKTRLAYGVIDS